MTGASSTPGLRAARMDGAGAEAGERHTHPSMSSWLSLRMDSISAWVVGGITGMSSGTCSPLAVSTSCPFAINTRPCSRARSNTPGAQVTRPGSSPPNTAHM